MKKTIITTLIIITVIGGFIWWGSTKQKPQVESIGQESALTASSKLYDFGTISMKNNEVTNDFIISNLTDKDIVVPTLVTSCMCTNAFIVETDGKNKGPFGMPGMGYVPPANETIKAGENRIIRVVYDPNAHGPAGVGSIDRFITLTDSTGRDLKLEIKAVVTP